MKKISFLIKFNLEEANMCRKAPEHCKHKPMYEIRDYHKIDAEYKDATDVHSLSVGKAQWDDNFEPSVKVWRQKNGKWSRQSEETTFTRAIDMAMLVLQVINHYENGKPFEEFSSVFGSVKVENAAYQQQFDGDLKKIINSRYKNDLMPHIELLKKVLEKF